VDEQQCFDLFLKVADFLACAADYRPIVLVLDDLDEAQTPAVVVGVPDANPARFATARHWCMPD
jgi:hypothetical protein